MLMTNETTRLQSHGTGVHQCQHVNYCVWVINHKVALHLKLSANQLQANKHSVHTARKPNKLDYTVCC